MKTALKNSDFEKKDVLLWNLGYDKNWDIDVCLE